MERLSSETFYVVGGTLARDAPSYVQREADRRLLTSLERGEVCYVLTSRQMGKSSLMVRTAVRLRQQGVSVAVVDLTSLGQNLTAMQWYNGLLERMGQQLSLEDEVEELWRRSEHLGPFQRWMQAMREVVLPSCKGNVVVFIDEIDTVRSLPFPTDELFAGIRELYNRRSEDSELNRLTFCLLGVATPADLIRDTRTTPFNIGRRIELTDFSEQEASPLASGMAREAATGQRLLKRVLHWTGGHPYLTQRLCQAVAEEGKAQGPGAVDAACSNLFLSHRARERDDNLQFVRDRILRSEVDRPSLLSLYADVRAGKRIRDDQADPLIAVLRLSGIVAVDQGYLKVRNRIYQDVFDRDWITSNLPGAEVRRQKAAYTKGFKRAALVSVPLMALLGASGYFLYRNNTDPPDLAKHVSPPVFWMSGAIRGAQAPPAGSLRLNLGDENVTVFINKQQYGNTGKGGQLLVPGLPVGDYEIRLEKPGFLTASNPHVPVFADNETHLAMTLQRLVTTGALRIADAPPETTVHVDGTLVGVTDASGNLTVNVSPGDHDLELSKDGFVAERFRRVVTLENTEVVDARLKPDQEARDWREANIKDPKAIQSFLKQYPEGRFAAEARRALEAADWNSVKDSNDLALLAGFVDRYPQGQFAGEAKQRSLQIQKEQEDYGPISNSTNAEALQQFLANHPDGIYAASVRRQLAGLKDQSAILDVIQQYQDAYDHQDLNAILRLWPKYPEEKKQILKTLFSNAQSGTLKLEPKMQPQIAGDHARVVCTKTRMSTGSTSKTDAEIRLVKEAGSWLIDGGTL